MLFRSRNFAQGMGSVLVHPFAAAKMAAANFGAVAATAFIGWQIGKRIGEMLKLEDAFTRLALRAKGMSEEEIDYHLSGEATKKVTPMNPSICSPPPPTTGPSQDLGSDFLLASVRPNSACLE